MGIIIVKVAYCSGSIGLVANNSCDPLVFCKIERDHFLGTGSGDGLSWPRTVNTPTLDLKQHG